MEGETKMTNKEQIIEEKKRLEKLLTEHILDFIGRTGFQINDIEITYQTTVGFGESPEILGSVTVKLNIKQ